MHGDQRHDQSALRTKLHDDRRHQRRDDDVVGRRRDAHAEDERSDGNHREHQEQVARRDHLDDLRKHQPDPGQRHGADDDARRRGRNRHTDHVARARDQARLQIVEALCDLITHRPLPAEPGTERALRDENEDEEHRRPERGQRRRKLFDHQVPDERDHRQQEMQTALHRRTDFRTLEDRRVRIVQMQFGIPGFVLQQSDIGRKHERGNDEHRRVAGHALDPAQAVIDDIGKHDHAAHRHQDVDQPIL